MSGASGSATMTDVSDADAAQEEAQEEPVLQEVELSLVTTFAVALVVGGALAATARVGATALLVAVAVAQALFAVAWGFGTVLPGRRGALVIAALSAAGADVATSVWPHDRLGTLLPVLGLAIPAMFVHQLARGAARVQVVSSLSAVAVLVLAEVSLASLLQLRHEFGPSTGGKVAAAAVAAIAGALVIGCLVDMLLPAPRFDPAVARGLLGLIASAGLGGSVGYLMLHNQPQFGSGRGTFTGAALGALAGFLAVATAYVLHTTPQPPTAMGRRLRPIVGALLPIAVVAPAAFLLCLAIRS
jgi:hypothetical protein